MTIKIKARRRTIKKAEDVIQIRIPVGLKAALSKRARAEGSTVSAISRGALCALVGWLPEDTTKENKDE